jgi:hypothetical protein
MGMSEKQRNRFRAMLAEAAERRAATSPPAKLASVPMLGGLSFEAIEELEPHGICFGSALSDYCEAWQRDQRKRRANIADSGAKLPDGVAEQVIAGNIDDTPALTAVHDWATDQDSPPWLVISGTVGRGKTLACVAAVAVLGGVFVRARELSRAFSAKFGDDHELQLRCFSSGFLVIDDLGRETDHVAMQGYLEDLLDERPNRRHRTVITTNLDAKQFAATYPDERLRSRLFQLARFVSDSGPDLRRGRP